MIDLSSGDARRDTLRCSTQGPEYSVPTHIGELICGKRENNDRTHKLLSTDRLLTPPGFLEGCSKATSAQTGT